MARTSSAAAVKLGSALRELRQHRGLTVDQLAATSGIDSSNVRSYESGRAMMNVKTLLRLAETLDAEPGQLLAGVTSAMFDTNPAS
ncbi:helix-turn-helix domain-containing protein [Microbacterium sp. CH1]|uniref:helix-turn-helix domain-containing protein n=1 Tax=Microbacterium sp. CH1 TaxID=1770208 RepID=UPI0009EE23C4|nr:helix-turn-helix transcriptional regulator [Microbacterium sp. CH1]